MAVRGVRRRWTAAIVGGLGIVAALGWALLAGGDRDARLERASWVGAIVTTLAVVAALMRWAWLWQAGRRMRELAGPEGFLGAAPRVVPHFVDRPDLTGETVRALLGGARVVALAGFGGAGKSTLAAAVTRNKRLRRSYRQVTWLKVRPGTDPVTLLTELARRLGITEPGYTTLEQARDGVSAALAGRRLLIVLDNVWTREPLDAVLGLGPDCPVLYTTRIGDLVTMVGAVRVEVDQLTQDQAVHILARWTGTPAADLPPQAYRLCTRLQNLALGVAMVGAMAARGRTYADIWALIEQDLRRVEGDFDPRYDHPTLRAAIDVGIDDLPADDRDRYLRLAVFTSRGPFPDTAAAALWHPLPEVEVRRLLTDLIGRSLTTRTGDGWYIAHDLQYDTITQRLGPDRVRAAHNALLEGYRARISSTWAQLIADDPYLPASLPWHLAQAGRNAELVELLGQISWMHTRISAAGLPDLIGDYSHTSHPHAKAIRRALMQSTHALTAAPEVLAGQLAGQLIGRLMNHPDPTTAAWAVTLGPLDHIAWLRPLTPGALTAATSQLEQVISGHASPVIAVAFNFDGTRVLTASRDGAVRVWEIATGRELHTPTGHTSGLRAEALNADGTRALTGDFDGTTRIWETATGRELHTLTGDTGGLRAVALNADGTRALTVAFDGTTRTWETATGREPHTLTGHTSGLRAVALNADGTRALTVAFDGTTRIWETATGRKIHTLTGHTGAVNAVAFNTDGTRALTGHHDGTTRVWDLTQSAQQGSSVESFGSDPVITISADGARALTGRHDGTVLVWEVATGRELHTLPRHTRGVSAVAFDADGTRALTGDFDGTTRIWETATGRKLHTLTGNTGAVYSAAFNTDGTRALTGHHDGTTRIWETATGRELHTLTDSLRGVYSAAFNTEGTRALTGHHDGTVHVWELTTGRKLRTLTERIGAVNAVAFNTEGTRALTGHHDGIVQVWELTTGREVARWCSDRPVRWCRFSLDRDDEILIWVEGLHRLRLLGA
ncbi:NB-ARC domain-containing protein [Actinomadura litoris]|uniref:NB-ARC domain-containing protein n=1 Tax=Actinomadura litoris TaxID=2678616 RepID=UPI001FA7C64B|nr:NB-ARC domain-containing protein [Actinomadura litoris]